MEVKFIESKTFRYQILNDHPTAKTVLYVLHGYGQLAKFFIQKFKNIDPSILIIAPEGMHRFYRKGTMGKVGASWMTKEAREDDISDNMNYLNALDTEISQKHQIENRILLGFSQGGATAIRWKANGKISFDSLIIWASSLPTEIKWKNDFTKEKNNILAIGNEDEIIPHEQQQLLIDQYLSLGFKISPYIGRHDIDNDVLATIIKNIQKSDSFGTISD